MNEEIKSNYYAIIPATVRYDNELKPSEKLMYGEITALCNKNGYCYATNKYFATLYGVNAHTVSQWISHLEKLDYVKIELIRTTKKEVKERRIYICDIPYVQKNTYPYISQNTYSMDEKVQENNIKYNEDDLFYLIINNSNEIQIDFYQILEKLEFLYSEQFTKKMSKENLQKLKDIIFTIYTIFISDFRNIITKFERNVLVNIYVSCKEHYTTNFLQYYRQSIINKYNERF